MSCLMILAIFSRACHLRLSSKAASLILKLKENGLKCWREHFASSATKS